MYRINLIIVFASCIIFSFSCQNKKSDEAIQPPIPKEKQKIQKIEFIPPSDSMITSDQLKNWMSCNALLDSLAIMYADSFKTNDPQTRMRYQDDYSIAQDKICVLSGLKGGYKEYRWIMENIGNSKNSSIVKAANISVY